MAANPVALTFDTVLAELARQAGRQTAALYAHLIGRHGSIRGALRLEVAALLVELRRVDSRLFASEDEFRLLLSLWELGNWAIAWPGRASPRPVRRLLKWLPDRSGLMPGPTSAAAVIRVRLAPLPSGEEWVGARLVLL